MDEKRNEATGVPDLDPADVRIETYCPTPRPQWVAHTDKGIRATHIPTGITVEEHADRNQHRNKAVAYERLKLLVANQQPAADTHAHVLIDTVVKPRVAGMNPAMAAPASAQPADNEQCVWIVNDAKGEHVMMCPEQPTLKMLERLEARVGKCTVTAFLIRPYSAQPDRGAVQDDFVLMPKRLTAENGAKGALSGEFKESIEVPCPECHDEDEDYDCATCENFGRVSQVVTVGWDTIKDIYARAVDLLAQVRAAQPESATGTTGGRIDTPEFRRLLNLYFDACNRQPYDEDQGNAAWEELLAHIDAIIADLRAQLAAKGQGEPVAWLHKLPDGEVFGDEPDQNRQICWTFAEAEQAVEAHGGTLHALVSSAPASAQPDRGAVPGETEGQ